MWRKCGSDMAMGVDVLFTSTTFKVSFLGAMSTRAEGLRYILISPVVKLTRGAQRKTPSTRGGGAGNSVRRLAFTML
jgi:hypothetical protein